MWLIFDLHHTTKVHVTQKEKTEVYFFTEACLQVKNTCPTPAKINKTPNGRGKFTILRVSMIALPPASCTSCFFAGMLTCGQIQVAIPAAISSTPTIAIG